MAVEPAGAFARVGLSPDWREKSPGLDQLARQTVQQRDSVALGQDGSLGQSLQMFVPTLRGAFNFLCFLQNRGEDRRWCAFCFSAISFVAAPVWLSHAVIQLRLRQEWVRMTENIFLARPRTRSPQLECFDLDMLNVRNYAISKLHRPKHCSVTVSPRLSEIVSVSIAYRCTALLSVRLYIESTHASSHSYSVSGGIAQYRLFITF